MLDIALDFYCSRLRNFTKLHVEKGSNEGQWTITFDYFHSLDAEQIHENVIENEFIITHAIGNKKTKFKVRQEFSKTLHRDESVESRFSI